ncbi:MAG: hypothetical protein A2W97_09855 [Bacteroidetes bacterium GWE2_40_63]|nr:MAG: hypothetical protein A2W97_09855 [Bacteroidetes bacterium GWE2_40_63]OFY22764.1 MAG: hypothetical protein A2W88_00145 [Bacteroidetes bacterium GWF2_40_13]HAZ01873.1 hypothetical protein [Marinilabiliales bacterium]HCC30433.1 hypothetical protein [Marinilabiliales bacterium]
MQVSSLVKILESNIWVFWGFSIKNPFLKPLNIDPQTSTVMLRIKWVWQQQKSEQWNLHPLKNPALPGFLFNYFNPTGL